MLNVKFGSVTFGEKLEVAKWTRRLAENTVRTNLDMPPRKRARGIVISEGEQILLKRRKRASGGARQRQAGPASEIELRARARPDPSRVPATVTPPATDTVPALAPPTLFFGPLQPEMTPKVGATLPTTNASHSSTEGASCLEIGQGGGQQPSINGQQ
ncbi:hypothetical protein H5410_009151 [Solanum commersonii]|uniref:Uncharacterized protein n=1 Tax=Solanum commersonii TaxID=4109 RepID=A0A9J6AH08_SOLCO|nr:hypothetical protein H5410_009151 [Solanum commersonii]